MRVESMNGLIALVGSGEYLPVMNEIDRHLLVSVVANGRSPRVVCLPTAAGLEGQDSIARWSRMGLEHFQKLGAQVITPAIIDRASADDPRWQPLLESADMIYFSGGNPMYLYGTLKGSRAWDAAQEAWKRGAAFAGCSAGAMILAQKVPNFRYAGLKSMDAFQVLPASYILPHFDRMRGLWSAFLFGLRRQLKGEQYLVGIDENTALVGELGGTWQVMGQGSVHLIQADGQQEYAPGQDFSLPA
jgi:cyanophycinase